MIRCPKCRGVTRVLETRKSRNETRRERECTACGLRVTTYEKIARQRLREQQTDVTTSPTTTNEPEGTDE